MLMLRAGPRDGKHERRGAKTGSNKHRSGQLLSIDPVPLVSQDSPHAELLAGSKSQACGAASNASLRRGDPTHAEPRGGTGRGATGVEGTRSRQAAAGARRPDGAQTSGAAHACRVVVSTPAAPPAASPRGDQLGQIDPDRLG